ncbi:MAG: hypothetical protein M3349_09220 [Actinomycetota bacterium]|nr:hypothetical protein [Actinomycetota bacterium]
MTLVLAVATVLVVAAATLVARVDVADDSRSRVRVVVEALVPLAGVAFLLWFVWAAAM